MRVGHSCSDDAPALLRELLLEIFDLHRRNRHGGELPRTRVGRTPGGGQRGWLTLRMVAVLAMDDGARRFDSRVDPEIIDTLSSSSPSSEPSGLRYGMLWVFSCLMRCFHISAHCTLYMLYWRDIAAHAQLFPVHARAPRGCGRGIGAPPLAMATTV